MSDNTDATDTGSVTTDNSGQTDAVAGTLSQDDFAARLAEYETKLAQYAGLEQERKALDDTAKAAQAQARRWESSYKSLQASTTASLQDAARLRQQVSDQQRIQEELTRTRGEMAQVREGLSFIASKMVDEDAAKEFQLRQRETQLQQMEAAAQARTAALQQAPVQQQPVAYAPVDPDKQKREFLDYYFPESGIDHNDPSIDWGEGATDTPEAFRRFTTSVMKLREDQSQAKEAPVQSEAEKLLSQLREEHEALQKSQAQIAEEIKAQARRDVEERLRKMGVDSGGAPGTTDSAQKAATRLQELDETKLSSGEPSDRRKAAKNMEDELRLIRKQLLS